MDKLVGWVVVGLGIFAMFAIGTVAVRWPGGDWAAWVQAVGSVAAIFWAGRIARQQSRDARDLLAEERQMLLRAICRTLRRVQYPVTKTVDQIGQRKTKKGKIDYARARLVPFRLVLELVEKIPVHEVPYAYLGGEFAGVLNAYRKASAALNEIAELDSATVSSILLNARIERFARLCSLAAPYLKTIEDSAAVYDGKHWNWPDEYE